MKKKKRKLKTVIKNPSFTDLEEFYQGTVSDIDYIGHPGPATTLAAHRRKAKRAGR